MAIKIQNSTIIDDSRNIVNAGVTTVTSVSIGNTQVISSARQLQNIASLDATTTATIESAIANAPNTFTDLNVTGVSTFSGIATHTEPLFGTQASFTGVVTAISFSGNASSATYADNAGISTNLKGGLVGNLIYQSATDTTAFLSNGASGFVLQSNGVGNAPSWVSAAPVSAITGISIQEETFPVGTANAVNTLNFIGSNITATASGGISTITVSDNLVGTALSISGISTLGITSATNLTAQQLSVSGVSTISVNSSSDALRINQLGTGNALVVEDSTNPDATPFVIGASGSVGIGTTNPASALTVQGDVRVSGVVTATTFSGQVNAGVGTITTLSGTTATYGTGNFTTGNIVTGVVTTLTSTNATLTNINSSGITTLGIVTTTQISVSGVVTASQFTTGSGNLGFTTNTISGPSIILIDPSPIGVGTTSGAVRILGDLYVDGTQFIVNSSTIELADLRVGIATTVGTGLLLDGGGIGIGSANIVKTITWNNTANALTSNADWNLISGKQYEINGTSVLNATTLGSGVVNSSLTSVGTLGQLNVSGIASVTSLNVSGVSTVGFLTATNIWNAGITTSSRLTLNGANNTVDGGGQIYLNGATGNRIDFNTNGVAAPAFTTRSAGTKLVLYPSISGSAVDFAFGIQSATLWSSVPEFVSAYQFRWYGGTTQLADLKGTGEFLLGSSTLTGTATQRLQVTGGAYFSNSIGIGTTNPTSALTVQGDVRVSGVVTATSFSGDGSQLTGISASGSVSISTNTTNTNLLIPYATSFGSTTGLGATSLLVYNPSSGNLGIGTTNPGATLNVVPTATSIAGLFSGTTSSDMVRITQLGTGNALVVEDSTNPDSSPFVVTGIGSVGIGTASPSFTADIAGDARVTSTNKMRFGGTAGTTNFYIQYNSTANSLDFVAG